jgi:amidase
VVFPAAGDVGYADADIDVEKARRTWQNGVKYSNGNRCFRHLGVPSITVPMGLLRDKDMPMGLTFLGRAYEDVRVVKAGEAFENMRDRRTTPPRAPALPTDSLTAAKQIDLSKLPPQLDVSRCSAEVTTTDQLALSIAGTIDCSVAGPGLGGQMVVDVYVDGNRIPDEKLEYKPVNGSGVIAFKGKIIVAAPPEQDQRNTTIGRVARDQTMVIIVARRCPSGRPTGMMRLIGATK